MSPMPRPASAPARICAWRCSAARTTRRCCMCRSRARARPWSRSWAAKPRPLFLTTTQALPLIKAGKVRALAYDYPTRADFLPDVPDHDRSRLRADRTGLRLAWRVCAGRTRPSPWSNGWRPKSAKPSRRPTCRNSLTNLGLTPVGGSSAEFRQVVAKPSRTWPSRACRGHQPQMTGPSPEAPCRAINAPKDILAGLIFIAFGAGTFVLAHDYEIGTAVQMGPGYFPAAIGLVLAAIGVAAIVAGHQSQDPRSDHAASDRAPDPRLRGHPRVFLADRAGRAVRRRRRADRHRLLPPAALQPA